VSNFQASFKKRYKVLRVNLQYIKEICPFLNVYRDNSLLGFLKSPQNCNAYKWILRCVTRCSRIDHHNYSKNGQAPVYIKRKNLLDLLKWNNREKNTKQSNKDRQDAELEMVFHHKLHNHKNHELWHLALLYPKHLSS